MYSEYGIQPTDANRIAEKLGFIPGEYSNSQVEQIRSIHSEAKKSGMSLKAYLATIQVEQATPRSPKQRHDRIQAPTDETAVADFHLTVRSAVGSIVEGSIGAFAELDSQLADHENAVSTAFVERLKQSKDRTARLVISKLQHDDSQFFQFAPTGAAQTFADRAAVILALPDGGDSQPGYVLKQAGMVEEDDQGIEQESI